MSQKHHSKTKKSSPRQFSWLWLAVGAAVLLIAGGTAAIWTSSPQAAPPIPQPTTGNQAKSSPAVLQPTTADGPRLAVDQATIDEGVVKLGVPIRTTFHLKNVGNEPLQILGEPVVQLVEGC